MSDEQRDVEKKFKVKDRRLFTEEGELREEASETREAYQPQPPLTGPEDDAPEASAEAAKIDFSSFLLSLAGSAMMHLGETPAGPGPESLENLEAARQMIEILNLLKDKTTGNLSAEEGQLLDQVLYELQMTYVRKTAR